jgi:hypothetical protein
MSPRGLFWCGEGDLSSLRSLITRKLFFSDSRSKPEKRQKPEIWGRLGAALGTVATRRRPSCKRKQCSSV